MKLFEAKSYISKLKSVISESSLNYQTLYRYTNIKEALNLLSGAWEFNQFPFRDKRFIGDGKYAKKYGKSFTRSIRANGMILWKNSNAILLEIDKGALNELSGGKIIFKPYNFHHFYSSKDEVRNKVRGYGDEAEDVAILAPGSRIFKFDPNKANKFVKAIYCDKNKITDKKQLNELISLCKEYKIKLKFTNTETDSSKELDKVRDSEQITESNNNQRPKASRLNMYQKTNAQLAREAEQKRLAKQIDKTVVDHLTIDDLNEEDKLKYENLLSSFNNEVALTKTVYSSRNKQAYLNLANERYNNWFDEEMKGIHTGLRT